MRFELTLLLVMPGWAAALGVEPSVDYARDVKPILHGRCFACHGALKQKGKLRLDSGASILRDGGSSGPIVVPGRAADSVLFARVTDPATETRMPPEGQPLTGTQIQTLKAWIDQGAHYPADDRPEPDPRDHWAFRPPVRPAVPENRKPKSEIRNPIDRFLAAEWEKHGLRPQPPADRRLLLRRVYLDLTGLPPTADEQTAFLADAAPDAYERVVERLLVSPQYGERWGRHWLDVWRYSDWWGLGAEVRNSQKHIWHWRDWVIESVNADAGYDQMVRAMLAADESDPDDLDRLRATGFLARQYFKFNRNTWLDETVEHTAKAFLGLTLNCAKCHDHKYDPIAQADYYRFRAYFEPYQVRTEMVPGEPDFEADGIPRAFDCNLDAPTYLFVRGDEKRPQRDRPLGPALPGFLDPAGVTVRSVELPAAAHAPGLRPFVLENYLHKAKRELTAARDAVRRAETALDESLVSNSDTVPAQRALALAQATLAVAESQPAVLRARAAADRGACQKSTAAKAEKDLAVLQAEAALIRAEIELANAKPDKTAAATKAHAAAETALATAKKAAREPGETYTPLRGALKTPESNVEPEASRTKPFPTTSTGRRTALARWIADPRNPLTARVAVNHVWLRHFGQPLVATVFDFGRKGTPPTHPALLDWLAVEFTEHGWSMKHLHRLMVTSQAYRLSSSSAGAWAANRAIDPENRYLWRMNSVRMDAQAVRDGLLHLAGELDLKSGGPPLNPGRDDATHRRSVYFFHSHNEQHKFLALFDNASVLDCYRRTESIVPQQALALANSQFALTMAEAIADRVRSRCGASGDEAFVTAAFEAILATSPSAEERVACLQALAEFRAAVRDRPADEQDHRARIDLVHALLNHNDFVTVR
jgi:hypothetical protein